MSSPIAAVDWPSIRHEWRREWRLGIAVIFASATAMAAWAVVASLFVQPLQDAFGWTRSQIAFAANAGLVTALVYPFAGRLIDRLGVRAVLIPALLLTGLSYCGLAAMNGSLPLYYALYFAFSLFGIGTTGLAFTPVVSAAFVHTRGLALAVTRTGVALAGIVMPPLIYWMIASHGWRAGYLTMAALMLGIGLPLAWLFVHDRRAGTAPGNAKARERPAAWLTLLGNHRVILICFAGALTYAPVLALMSQLQPLLIGKGLSGTTAAGMIGLVGLAAFFGALISGLLVDRIWAPAIACIFTLGPAVGCMLLFQQTPGTGAVVAALLLLGLGQGAEIDVVAFMIARYFGLRSYASIYSLGVLAITLMSTTGSVLIAANHDRFGDYQWSLMGAAFCFVIAAGCYLGMGRYPDPAPR